MGYIYLAFFLGLMGWKFNGLIEDFQNPVVYIFIAVVIILILLLVIRFIIRQH